MANCVRTRISNSGRDGISNLANEFIKKTIFSEGYWYEPDEALVIDLILKEQ